MFRFTLNIRFILWAFCLLMCVGRSYATDFTYKGIIYTVLTDGTCETKQGFNDNGAMVAGNSVSGDIVIPKMVLNEDGEAFAVTAIGKYSFCNLRNLTSVVFSNKLIAIDDYAFYGCSGLISAEIPNSVSYIGNYAYWGCISLTAVVIPDLVSSISEYAFAACTKLTSVTIPRSVKTIGKSAFSGCSGLTTIVIPPAVSSIGNNAFAWCKNVKVIISKSIIPPTISDGTFAGCYAAKLIAASEEYATTDYWKDFGNIIFPTNYNPLGSTFESGGFKYEIVSLSDHTCRLYAIDESVVGENIVIPKTVEYKNYKFTPIEIKGTIVSGESSAKSLYIPDCVTTMSEGILFNTTLEKVMVHSAVLPAILTTSSVNELVISADVNEVSADFQFNTIDKITIEDSSNPLITLPIKSETSALYLGRNVSSCTFRGMNSLENITISEKLTSIDQSLFEECCGLTSVVIPNSVTTIGQSAFAGCKGLTAAAIPNSVIDLGNSVFSGCSGLTSLGISNSVSTIGDSVFFECSGLTSVVIPNSVITIGRSAFEGCSGLTSVVIPNSVTTIGRSAFALCSGLTSLTISNSATTIDEDAFLYCRGLTSVVIPNSVTTIGRSAFEGCSGLTSLTISNALPSISESTFANCRGLTAVVIPESITNIGDLAFLNCGFTSLSIPKSITTIGNAAFLGCDSIAKLKFEDGNEFIAIGENVFSSILPTEAYLGRQMDFTKISYAKMESLTFGTQVSFISTNAFVDGNAVRTVISYNPVPPSTENIDIFSSKTYLDGTLYVPESSIEAYKTANSWKNFWEIKPIPGYSGVNEIISDIDTSTISIENGSIYVNSASLVNIVTMKGANVYKGRGNCKVNVEPGIYIIIIGNTNYKVLVK